MRQSRWDWLARFFQPKAAPEKVKVPATGRRKTEYAFVVDGQRYLVPALTRSEARAALKKHLKLRRLPVGA